MKKKDDKHIFLSIDYTKTNRLWRILLRYSPQFLYLAVYILYVRPLMWFSILSF